MLNRKKDFPSDLGGVVNFYAVEQKYPVNENNPVMGILFRKHDYLVPSE
jgi:hypothetical protein